MSVDATLAMLDDGAYVARRELATAVYLALTLARPLLLEGESGVGKTEIAKVLASRLGRQLIRLQCFEGLDLANAAYEWNYPRQVMAIRLAEAQASTENLSASLYSDDFLLERPLLSALKPCEAGPPVLLIDEVDRADAPFEAFLLEFLSEYQLSIPELGVVRAETPPIVILTSNRTRDVHDALRRRCLFHWLDYPDAEAEERIVALRAPGIAAELRGQVVRFVQQLRGQDLYKRPGIAETLDWSAAVARLGVQTLTSECVDETLGTLLKYRDDVEQIRGATSRELLAVSNHAA